MEVGCSDVGCINCGVILFVGSLLEHEVDTVVDGVETARFVRLFDGVGADTKFSLP